MHAYSILDVREIPNVGVEFFKDHLLRGTLGNVSGFTEYDGKVRLLQIRNPHGRVRFVFLFLFFFCVYLLVLMSHFAWNDYKSKRNVLNLPLFLSINCVS